MKLLKNIWSQLHLYLLWGMASVLIWGLVFSFLTDAPPEKKVTLFIDVEECRDQALREELEKDLPEGIRMIQVHPFSYAMFNEQTLLDADLYIVPASNIEDYHESFLLLPGAEIAEGREEGGILVHSAASGDGIAASYIGYDQAEDYYLFFGVNSLHASPLSGRGDDAAFAVADTLLQLGKEGEKP